jgi:hypothetical protein
VSATKSEATGDVGASRGGNYHGDFGDSLRTWILARRPSPSANSALEAL